MCLFILCLNACRKADFDEYDHQTTISMQKVILLLLGVAVLLVEARIGRGLRIPEVHERSSEANVPVFRFARDSPKNEDEMRAVTNPSKQCEGYGFKEQSAMRKKYPKDNEIASILDGDEEAQKIWKEIKESGIIPEDVKVKKGTEDHMGIADDQDDSYPDSDPDCWWTENQCTKPKHDGLSPDVSECPEKNTWGLTFDDGPNCSHNAFYNFLERNKLKATLFFIGSNVMDWPYQAQRALVDGHDICGHTWSHHYMTTLSNEEVFAELYYTLRIIKDVVGVTTRCWRPPFGDTDDRVRAIAHGLGLRTILWSDDTDDWNIEPSGDQPTATIDGNYKSIASKQTAGSYSTGGPIVLTHEIDNHTMTEFERMYPVLKDAFKHIVPATACMNVTRPYAEEKPKYPTFKEFVNGERKPKGLPDSKDMKIHVMAPVTITPVGKQTEPGGYSPKAPADKPKGNGTESSTGKKSSDGEDKEGKSGGAVVKPSLYSIIIIFIAIISC